MKISVVIPAHNEGRYLGECLASVIENAGGRVHEVIVVDNASTDTTAAVASAYPTVRLIRTEKKGLTHARQIGLEASTGDLIAYIDADCRVDKQWLPAIESHFAQHPYAASLTGPIWYYDGSVLERSVVVALQWCTLPFAYFLAGYLVIGGNFVASREALLRVGGFDTDIAFYGEDADIARRLSKIGPTYLRMHFVTATSARRISREGIVRTYLTYGFNFLSHVFLRRSLTRAYTDLR